MKTFTFTVTEEQANLILNALGAQPFNVVAPLLEELQSQANAQSQEVEEKLKES
ncbi:MAG: hypothetical protein GY906_23520 [bacterium]|nr:hypothetical protein [bacterium]